MNELSNLQETRKNSGEYAELAARIMGVKEIRVTFSGNNFRFDINYCPLFTASEKINYFAFNSYFYKNYGYTLNGSYHCDFSTLSEAFFQLLKAWDIWNNSLDNNKRNEYIKRELDQNHKDDTDEDTKYKKEFWMRDHYGKEVNTENHSLTKNNYWADLDKCIKIFFPADKSIATISDKDDMTLIQKEVHTVLVGTWKFINYEILEIPFLVDDEKKGSMYIFFSASLENDKQIHKKLTSFEWSREMHEEIGLSIAAPIASTYQSLFDMNPETGKTNWFPSEEFFPEYIEKCNNDFNVYYRTLLQWHFKNSNEVVSYYVLMDSSLLNYLFEKDNIAKKKEANSFILTQVNKVMF